MLSAEEAHAALAERREQAVMPGPRGLFASAAARAARALIDPQADRSKAAGRIAKLAAPARRMAFSAALPGLGGELTQLYEDAGAMTYQSSWSRRPFRAPTAPQLAQRRVLEYLATGAPDLVAHGADPAWLARWAGHLMAQSWSLASPLVGWLLATAIDAGDDAVFDILVATIDGTDDVATMGRHVPTALLCAGREDGWERVERLLLAAQRQEGLRQSILEVVDEAHPQAFQRMLALIVEHDLTRFASVARAMSVWLGIELLAGDGRRLTAIASRSLELLRDPPAIVDGEPLDIYLALWAIATRDAEQAIARAEPALCSDDAEQRFAAVRFLAETQISTATPALVRALRDEDLRVAAYACQTLAAYGAAPMPASYDALEALLARLPKRAVELEAVSWLGPLPPLKRETVAGLLFSHVDPPQIDRVLPHAKALGPWDRGRLVDLIAKGAPDGPRRAALLDALSDASPDVRSHAIAAMGKLRLDDVEALALEPLLKRKPGDLRRGVLDLIAGRGDAWALQAAGRLLAGSDQQRLGGVDLLRRITAAGSPHAARARELLATLEADENDDTAVAEATRRAVRNDPLIRHNEADGFGLFDEAELTRGAAPRRTGFAAGTPAALRVIALLDELICANAGTEIEMLHWGTSERLLLGAADGLNLHLHALRLRRGDTDLDLPLGELWHGFADELPPDARDADDQQILRAHLHCSAVASRFSWGEKSKVGSALGVRHVALVTDVLSYLAFVGADERRLSLALDAAEEALASTSARELARREWDRAPLALQIARELVAEPFAVECPDLVARHWRLELWLSEPPGARPQTVLYAGFKDHPRASKRRPMRPPDAVVARAFTLGAASEADMIDHLVGPRGLYWEFNALGLLSTRRGRELTAGGERVAEVVERVRERVVAIELARGEEPTAAASAVLALRRTGGLEVLAGALSALGDDLFVRGWARDGESRAAVFSHVVAASAPGEDDTPERFRDATSTGRARERRLRELACYAPQWARHVELALDLPGLADAVWWLHAHTKDDHWKTEEELREGWSRAIAERTALSSQELIEGAVDVAWFAGVRERVGDEQLGLLLKATKYASTAGGHKRAELFARAMRGDVTEEQLAARIAKSRHQDSVRAIGLLPLPASERDATLNRRYELLQEYKRESRRFGRQRQASEARATEIALQNLARTAGFADPVRLTWAMEAHATADLADGGVTVEQEGVTVNVAVGGDGKPVVTVRRGDKALKAVPAKLRKVPEVKAVTDRTTELRRQASRIKASLEQAMVRGDEISGAELADFHEHVLLWPAISRLVLIGEDAAGFPDRGGRVLRDPAGGEHAVGPTESLRIAHPVDLLDREWASWQHHVMSGRLVQPFKQVFRELYVPVEAEMTDDRCGSRRYAGHQVQPARARALLSKRGWLWDDELGPRRIDHAEHIAGTLWSLNGFGTPVDVEAPVLEELRFYDVREGQPIALADVPPRLFSEVMRDVDLVVSVAHVAGVDPEASQSSLEIRGALVAETCALLGMDNVAVDGPRALIDGQIARYAVHLGSANVQRMPGGSVCIVPVHSQQRGRVFLPFADDDPKTAELVAKVLMLARDRDIRDPTILEQLRH